MQNDFSPKISTDQYDGAEYDLDLHLYKWREWQKTRNSLTLSWSALVQKDWVTLREKLSATEPLSLYRRVTSKVAALEAQRQGILALSEDDWSKPTKIKLIHKFFVNAAMQAAQADYWPAEPSDPGFDTIDGKKNLHNHILWSIDLDQSEWEDVWPLKELMALQWPDAELVS